MPDLGKAIYTLALSTTQLDGPLRKAEAQIATSTRKMGTAFAQVEGQMALFGDAAVVTSAKVSGANAAMAASTVESTAVMTAAEQAYAAKSLAAANLYSAGWTAAHAKVQTMAAATTKHLKLAGLGAVAFLAMSGIADLKENNAAMAQVSAHIESTGGVAGVTAKHVENLSAKWIKLAGVEDEATQSAAGLLLTFPKIRNMMGKGNDIFDQTVTAVQNVATTFGKTLPQAAILVGKAINDPIKGMLALNRAGVQFTAAQKVQVKALVESGKGIQAQKLILKELSEQTGGSAVAAGKSFEGQLNRQKEELSNSAAVITSAFLPAFAAVIKIFGAVAGLMAGHTTLIRTLVFAYVAWKLALIAFAAVEKTLLAIQKTRLAFQLLMTRRTQQSTAAAVAATTALGAQAIAEQAVGNSALVASGKVGALRTSLLRLALMGILKVGIVYEVTYQIIKQFMPDLGRDFSSGTTPQVSDAFGNKGTAIHADNKKRNRWVGKDGKVTGKITGQAVWRDGRWVNPKTGKPLSAKDNRAAVAGWLRERPSVWAKKHDKPKENSVANMYEYETNNTPTVEDLNKDFASGAMSPAQRKAFLAKKAAKAQRERLKKEKATRDKADALWSIEEAQAERKSEGAHKAALKRHAAYLKNILSTQKMDLQVQASYEQELTSTLSRIEAMEKTAADKADKRPKLNLFPAILRARVAKAGKNKEEAIKAWQAEKKHLQGLLGMAKYNAEEKAKIQEQIYLVDNKITALREKTDKDQLALSDKDRIKLARAERTEDLKDDLKFWNARETAVRKYLKGLLASKKRDLSKIADAEEELTRILNTIKGLHESMNKKLGDSMKLDFLNTRAGFFGSFGPNIFNQTTVKGVTSRAPRAFANGGMVGGTGKGDTVPAMLTPGELVLNAAQQKRLARQIGVGSGKELFSLAQAQHLGVGGFLKKVAKGAGKYSGATQMVSDAYWAITHPRDNLMGRGRAQGQLIGYDEKGRPIYMKSLEIGGVGKGAVKGFTQAPDWFKSTLKKGVNANAKWSEKLSHAAGTDASMESWKNLSKHAGKSAPKMYSASSYNMNRAIRAGKDLTPGLSRRAASMDTLIAGTKLPRATTFYRGLPPLDSIALKNLKVGSTVSDSGFMNVSTSKVIANAFTGGRGAFNNILKIKVPKGHGYIPGGGLSAVGEREIVLGRNQRLKIVGHKVIDGKNIWEAVALPPASKKLKAAPIRAPKPRKPPGRYDINGKPDPNGPYNQHGMNWDGKYARGGFVKNHLDTSRATGGGAATTTTVHVNQHFPTPTADGAREARYARTAMQAAFD